MKKILVLIVVLILVVLGYWLYKTNGSVFPTVVGENSGNTDSASLTDTSLKDEADAFANADLSEIYEDPTYGFSLKYPSGLEPILIPADPESDTVDMFIFEQNGTGLGFQIIVSEFLEENADITPERILKDIPDMVIKKPEEVNLGEGRGKGTTFLDGEEGNSETNRQIWFAANGHLFQITSMPVFDKAMQKILATWTLN